MDLDIITYAAQGGKCGLLHQPGFSSVCLKEQVQENNASVQATSLAITDSD